MNVYVEFEGVHDITFSYVPTDDDPFVEAALHKNSDLLIASLKTSPPTDIVIG